MAMEALRVYTAQTVGVWRQGSRLEIETMGVEGGLQLVLTEDQAIALATLIIDAYLDELIEAGTILP